MTVTLLLCICILIMNASADPGNTKITKRFLNLNGENGGLSNLTPEMIAKLLSSKNLKNLNGKSFDLSSLKGGNGRFKQIIREKFHPVNQTLNISVGNKTQINGSLFSYKNWYKNMMNGKNGGKDIRNLIKGNIVESKHSKVIPFILDEEGFRQFKRKNPNHKYIYAQTMKIMNDQEMQHLQTIKSELKNLIFE